MSVKLIKVISNSKHAKFGVALEFLLRLWTNFTMFLIAFIGNLEYVFVYQLSLIDLKTLFPELEYVAPCLFEASK